MAPPSDDTRPPATSARMTRELPPLDVADEHGAGENLDAASELASLRIELSDLRADTHRLAAANVRNEHMVAELRAVLDTLLQILRVRETLQDGHLQMMDRLRRHAKLATEPQLILGTAVDKYSVESGDIDCASLLHLCHGRCCAFNIPLSEQDLAEGKLAWRIREPYLMAQADSGYCTYLDEHSGGCGNYLARPAPCRSYDCRRDPRVWIDFDAKVPAPMPEGLVTIRLRAGAGRSP
ncbi:MAG TPA: YkgJ family cysteine cluster protein [Kofleriaceae bacterium]|nr:YkgJ family cysteine cluster protein [Kofleriaceae bacterium]